MFELLTIHTRQHDHGHGPSVVMKVIAQHSASVAYSITGIFSGYTPLFRLPESSLDLIPLDLL